MTEPFRRTVRGVAVDDDGTVVREDALWVEAAQEGFRLFMSVPDVCSQVSRGEEAVLSTAGGGQRRRELSLSEERAVPAVTIEMTVSPKGRLTAFSVYRSTLRLAAVTTFREFADGNSPALPGTELAAEAANALRAWRLSLWDDRSTVPTVWRERRAVSEIIVAANVAATYFVHGSGRSLIYSRAPALQPHGGRRRWSLQPERMPRIFAERYATFLTPLNRRSDLANVRCLVAAAEGAPEPYSAAALSEIAVIQTMLPSRLGKSSDTGRQSLADLTPAAFTHAVEDICRGMAAPPDFGLRLRERLASGQCFAATMVWLLIHPGSPADIETREKLVAHLRGADGGARMMSFWAQASAMLGTSPVTCGLASGDEETGYAVRAVDRTAAETGRGNNPEAARRAALGRLAARAAGTDPDLPPAAGVRMLTNPHERVTKALNSCGWPPYGVAYSPLGDGHECTVTVSPPERPALTFSGFGSSKVRALGITCEKADASLPEPPLRPAVPLTGAIADELSGAYGGRPERALTAICKRCGLPPPEFETLEPLLGAVRSRVSGAGLVSVGTGKTGAAARTAAAADILDRLTVSFAPPGRAP